MFDREKEDQTQTRSMRSKRNEFQLNFTGGQIDSSGMSPTPDPPPPTPSTKLKLCGGDGSRCVEWDISDSASGLVAGSCYNLNQTVGGYDLSKILKSGNYCNMGGVASIPHGYSLQVNSFQDVTWPTNKDSCTENTGATNIKTITEANCATSGCTSSTGFEDWNKYCAFKLTKN